MTQSEIFEAEDTCRDRKACVEAKHVVVARHPSDEENLKTSKTALEGLVFLVVK
jgi:preprotein translocase subunit Sss1